MRQWPAALLRLSLAAATAILVAAPWLIYTAHVRYLAPLTAMAVLYVGCGIALSPPHGALREPLDTPCLGCVFFAVYIPFQDARLAWQISLHEDPASANRRRIRRAMAATITHHDPVIVFDPYYFSYDTGAQALSIPDADDAYLMSYTDRYHSRRIILSNDEVRFWKPDWEAQLPSWLRIRAVSNGNTLFERIAQA